MQNQRTKYFQNPDQLMAAAKEHIVETDVALDIGCGIVPMNYFRPKLHIMAEPWHEYSAVLRQRHHDDKSVLILSLGALEVLQSLQPDSVDSIFMLDVIEHLDKELGEKVILEIERVCRRQAVLFTPLGFMPQHMESGEKDAWGFSGAAMQEHRSGWLPEEFGQGWQFLVCEEFHKQKFNGDELEKPFGAFFAIRDFKEKPALDMAFSTELRKPLPSELKVDELKHELFLANIEAKKFRATIAEQQLSIGQMENKIASLEQHNRSLEEFVSRSFFGKIRSLLRSSTTEG